MTMINENAPSNEPNGSRPFRPKFRPAPPPPFTLDCNITLRMLPRVAEELADLIRNSKTNKTTLLAIMHQIDHELPPEDAYSDYDDPHTLGVDKDGNPV